MKRSLLIGLLMVVLGLFLFLFLYNLAIGLAWAQTKTVMYKDSNQTVTAVHTYAPPTIGPPFTVTGNGVGQVVTGLGTDFIGSSSVAGLGAATSAGKLRRITDGKASGSLVVSDGANWNCDAAKSQNIHNATCPPYNAKCDVQYPANNSINAGSNVLSATGVVFTSADIGKIVLLPGQTATGGVLHTTITGVSGSNAILANPVVPGTTKMFVAGAQYVTRGEGYVPGQTITLAGGVGTVAAVLTIRHTAVSVFSGLPSIINPGSGGKNGDQQIYGTTGNGNRFVLNVTIAGGALSAINSVEDGGHYTSNPTNLNAEPVAGAGLTGATISLKMGVDLVEATTPGVYDNGGFPPNPATQAATSGSGVGATFDLQSRFNSQMFIYGTDDSAVLNSLLSVSDRVVTLPEGSCGVATTLEIPGDRTELIGQGSSQLTTGVRPPGTTLQWLGAQGGKIMRVMPPQGVGDREGYQNRVMGINFMCPVHRGGQFVHVADVGLELIDQASGEFADLSFAACRQYGVLQNTSGTGSDNIHNSIHDIYLLFDLFYDGIGMYLTGATTGVSDTGIQEVSEVFGSYRNRPMMQYVTLDGGYAKQLHFFHNPNSIDDVFGLDISGGVYGSGEAGNHADALKLNRVYSAAVMRGLESSAVPPRSVYFTELYPGDPPLITWNEPITARPGHGRVSYTDWVGKSRFGGPFAIGQGSVSKLSLAPGDFHIDSTEQARILMSDTRLAGNQIGAITYDSGTSTSGGGWRFQKLGDGGSVIATLATLHQDTGAWDLFPIPVSSGLNVRNTGVSSLSLLTNMQAGALNVLTQEDDQGLYAQGTAANNAPGLVIAPWKTGAAAGIRLDSAGRVGISTATLNADSALEVAGHIAFEGATPSLASCGTTPSLLAGSNDTVGFITVGSGGPITSCTLNFADAFAVKPPCQVQNTSQAASFRVNPAVGSVVFSSATDLTGNVLSYFCPSLG